MRLNSAMPTKLPRMRSCSHTTLHKLNVSSFFQSLAETKLYSFLMDGSTKEGNIELEIVIILLCKKDDVSEEVKSHTRFLSMAAPEKEDASGLLKCCRSLCHL